MQLLYSPTSQLLLMQIIECVYYIYINVCSNTSYINTGSMCDTHQKFCIILLCVTFNQLNTTKLSTLNTSSKSMFTSLLCHLSMAPKIHVQKLKLLINFLLKTVKLRKSMFWFKQFLYH